MAWEVVLIGSSISPSPESFASSVDAALAKIGVTGSIADEEIYTRDGGRLIFYRHDDGGMFRLRDFSPAIAETLFTIADASRSFLADTSSGSIFRTPDNTGLLGDEDYDAIRVATAAELEMAMSESSAGAIAYTEQVIASIGAEAPRPSLLDRLFGGLFGKR